MFYRHIHNIVPIHTKFTVKHQDCILEYGLGGVHGFVEKPTIFEETEDTEILSLDATSYYPFFNFRTGICPAHIPKEVFNPLYRSFFEERKLIPKKDPMNYVLKILLNSSYGLTKDLHSFLYDPFYTMSVTINSQLYLSMLIERLEHVATCIMSNTDGCEFIVRKKDKEEYFKICEAWEKELGYYLEHAAYKKMIVRDVNNYLSIFTDGSIKHKGCFEFKNLPVHKNKSMLIVAKALHNYYVENIPIKDTVYNCNNIFDFCKGVKGKGDSEYFIINKKTGEEIQQQKTNRYYISNDGNFFVKRLPKLENKPASNQIDIFGDVDDGTRESQVEAGYLCTIYNKHAEKKIAEYDINYQYYILEINKITNLF